MSSLLSRRARRMANSNKEAAPTPAAELEMPPVPPEFRCPISLDLMRDPVAGPTGITYDRAGIEAWLRPLAPASSRCPVTGGELLAEDLVPNHALRRVIQAWCVANRARGVERVPTPRVPLTAGMAGDAVGEVVDAGDAPRRAAAARRVAALAREAERDRRCLTSAGAARALADAFASFSHDAAVLGDVLSALVLVMPLDEEAITAIGASSSAVAWLVAAGMHGDLQRRLQAVVVIKEVVSFSCSGNGDAIDLCANVDGIVEVLVKTIRDRICPPATKSALVAAHHLALAGEQYAAAARLAAAGIVPVLVELLVDGDRSTSEKALAALDAALASGDGRARARADALAVPVLVKKMFRVSGAATELVVSALWRICMGCRGGDDDTARRRAAAVGEAMQVGAFQKLLLLLQVGCRDATKEKATELLRLMSRHQSRGVECIDTMDLRGIKRGH